MIPPLSPLIVNRSVTAGNGVAIVIVPIPAKSMTSAVASAFAVVIAPRSEQSPAAGVQAVRAPLSPVLSTV